MVCCRAPLAAASLALALGVAPHARAQDASPEAKALAVRAAATPIVAGGSGVFTKARAGDPVPAVSATACAPCSSDAPASSRPLIAALPAGESYELRILRSAVSGFRLRASDANAPASADERLRLRISRQQVSILWQTAF